MMMNTISWSYVLNKRFPHIAKNANASAGNDYWWVALSGQLGESQVRYVVVPGNYSCLMVYVRVPLWAV